MPGVRLQHPTQRNVRFNVSDPNTPMKDPYQCTPPEFGGCGQVHLFKTHHLTLDETGTVIVEAVLYEKIKAHLMAFGFRPVNVVEKPPAMGIGLGPAVEGRGQWGNIPIVQGKE